MSFVWKYLLIFCFLACTLLYVLFFVMLSRQSFNQNNEHLNEAIRKAFSPWHCSTIYLLRDLFICKTFSMQKKKRNSTTKRRRGAKRNKITTLQPINRKKNNMEKNQRNIVGAMAKAWRAQKEGKKRKQNHKKGMCCVLSTRNTNTRTVKLLRRLKQEWQQPETILSSYAYVANV